MSGVRVLVGTRKGAFVMTSDGKRERWDVSGPHFGGWEIYHLKGSPADPNRLYASQSIGWFGQVLQRSDDGGQSWEPADNRFVYDGVPGTHQWYDGTPHPWEFKRVWHLEPSPTDPETVYAGVEDAALFRSTDGGRSWHELSGLLKHGSGPHWQPGAGGLCLHTILLDPSDAQRIVIASRVRGSVRRVRSPRVPMGAWVFTAGCLLSLALTAQEHPATPHAHPEAQSIQNPIASSRVAWIVKTRSRPVISKIFVMLRSLQTSESWPSFVRNRLTPPTSTPRVVESMKVVSEKSTTTSFAPLPITSRSCCLNSGAV